MRAFLVLIAVVLVACAATPPRAAAGPGIEFGLTDDAWLASGDGSVADRVATLQRLGVRVVRFSIEWPEVAPTRPVDATDSDDPAYDWSTPDSVLDSLHSAGVDVVLQLVGTPGWANGGKPANYAPTSGSSFGAFARAAAHRYPWAQKWLIWNEPNQVRWLRPTSALIYVTRLLNPAYTAIHAEIPGALVAGGGTAPRGSTGGVSPVSWLLAMHRAHARLDAYAHNPYPLDPRTESPLRGGCTHCATITMATLQRLESLVARNFPRARIWLTEYGYQTNPPDRILGVPLPTQARYVSEAAYVAYHAPRVDLLIHFLYRDEPELARFQSGLVTLRDVAKPALAAFELPLAVTARSGATAGLWGQLRAPAAGSVATLERKVGAAWRTFATVHADVHGVYVWRGTLPRGALIRVRTPTLTGAPLLVS